VSMAKDTEAVRVNEKRGNRVTYPSSPYFLAMSEKIGSWSLSLAERARHRSDLAAEVARLTCLQYYGRRATMKVPRLTIRQHI